MPTIPRTSDPAVIEHRLLDLAYTTDSTITVPALALVSPIFTCNAKSVICVQSTTAARLVAVAGLFVKLFTLQMVLFTP